MLVAQMGRATPVSYLGRWCVLLGLLQLLQWAPSALAEEQRRDPRGPGTIHMAERLEKLAQQADPIANPFLSAERVKALRPLVELTTDPAKRQGLRYSLASALLDSGQNAQALSEFEELEQSVKALDPQAYLLNRTRLKINEALCWMRV